ncbi:MAG: hypothetical protein ACQERN_04305 [Thermodesulfobacteriota bacterium]
MKQSYDGKTVALLLLAGAFFLGFACQKQEEPVGNLTVTEQSFVVRKDKDHAYVIDGRGRVQNLGQSDVKRVVVTANCLSCREEIIVGEWFISDIEKTEDQKDTISYIAAGDDEAFAIKDVAFIYNNVPEAPQHLPEEFEVVIESFETVTE